VRHAPQSADEAAAAGLVGHRPGILARRSHGISAKRVMTDNAFTYVKNRSLRELLASRGVSHRTTKPRRPRTAPDSVAQGMLGWRYPGTDEA
jgi:hypothetical protein